MRTTQSSAWTRGALLSAAIVCAALPVRAHENTPSVVALKEVQPGRFLVRWSPPSPEVEDAKLRFPEACRIDGASVLELVQARVEVPLLLDCGTAGLGGEIRFEAEGATERRLAVNVQWLDRTESFRLSSFDPPRVTLGASGKPNDVFEVLRRYLWLGVEHIWFGVDHLLFLLGLLVLVRSWRSLLATVTAFTVAHSVTLGAASLGLVAVPTAPVEIGIALSVLLLGVEATRGPHTASRRWPWLVALGFGLLHGLGFASALSDVGLPKDAQLLALVGFNLGVEAGQIAVVSLLVMGYLSMRSRPQLEKRVESLAIGLLGGCAVYWLLQRVQAWLAGLGG